MRVSVLMFVRNGGRTIRRAINSVLSQSWPVSQFVVQDGASTDGTLSILHSYGDRLEVVSEPDSGPSDGLLRALRRCTGDVVGSCLADEEMLPNSARNAVSFFLSDPSAGALTGDAVLTDLNGRQTGRWEGSAFDLPGYLLGEHNPYFCSSFFRRSELIRLGLDRDGWELGAVEFDLWCRLGADSRVVYRPWTMAKYANHRGQSTNRHLISHLEGRLKKLETLCGPDRPSFRTYADGQVEVFYRHAVALKDRSLVDGVLQIKRSLADIQLQGI